MAASSAAVVIAVCIAGLAVSSPFFALEYATLLLAGGCVAAWAGAMVAVASIDSGRALAYFKER